MSIIDESAELKRENKTIDIVKRIGVLIADRVHLINHAAENPVTIFNPSILIENQDLKIYSRIVLGYFTYASSILELCIPLEELEDISKGHYCGRLVVKPDNAYDIWGAEDPRASIVGGRRVITYCGRTLNYFNPIRVNRVLPLIAIHDDEAWRKTFVFRYTGGNMISDKDAFLADMNGLKIFHRIHTSDEAFYCAVNDVPDKALNKKEFTKITTSSTKILIKSSGFEEKNGWGTPPVKVGNEYLILLHGVDKYSKWYKVFAALMDEHAKITAVTRHYIMEPRENYEVYGDRPFTVFPCGLCRVDDKLLVSYGAADFAVGIGEIDLSELMSMLDSNRIQ